MEDSRIGVTGNTTTESWRTDPIADMQAAEWFVFAASRAPPKGIAEQFVIPAKAGDPNELFTLDPGLCRGDQSELISVSQGASDP